MKRTNRLLGREFWASPPSRADRAFVDMSVPSKDNKINLVPTQYRQEVHRQKTRSASRQERDAHEGPRQPAVPRNEGVRRREFLFGWPAQSREKNAIPARLLWQPAERQPSRIPCSIRNSGREGIFRRDALNPNAGSSRRDAHHSPSDATPKAPRTRAAHGTHNSRIGAG